MNRTYNSLLSSPRLEASEKRDVFGGEGDSFLRQERLRGSLFRAREWRAPRCLRHLQCAGSPRPRGRPACVPSVGRVTGQIPHKAS